MLLATAVTARRLVAQMAIHLTILDGMITKRTPSEGGTVREEFLAATNNH